MKETSAIQEFERIRDLCSSQYKQLELWPSYYERRYQEFLTFFDLLPQKKFTKVLELGCGIGYYSAFLSKISTHVVATDLEVADPSTHSPGLQPTRDFLHGLAIDNVQVLHASAEELPFDDASFDLVFSSHVLEHIPDLHKAIAEINRVLKPGGINFCVVPTTTDRLYTFFVHYLYLLQRGFAKMFAWAKPKKASVAGKDPVKSSTTQSFRHYARYLPFPPPHGVYNSYLKEVKNWTLSKWRSLVTANGKYQLVAQHGLQMNPFLSLLGVTLPKLGVRLFSMTRRTENRLSSKPFFKYFGISTLMITRK